MKRREESGLPAEAASAPPKAAAAAFTPQIPTTQAGAGPILSASSVLQLQRTSGNRAVTAILARNGPDGGVGPVAGVMDIYTLIGEGRWNEVVAQLDQKTDAELTEQLHRIRRTDLEQIRDAAPQGSRVRGAAEQARIRQLGIDYEDAVNNGRWAEAMTLVNAYNDLDLLPRLQYIANRGPAALASAASAAAGIWADPEYRVRRMIDRLQHPDVMAGTHAPTEREHAEVEAILHPGSTVVVQPPTTGGAPPTVRVQGPPAMTGGGAGGPFEQAMIAALRPAVRGWANVLRQRKAAGPAAFPMAQGNDIAHAAQEQVEGHFGSLIKAASRRAGDLYHPGSFDLATVLGDQSTRAIAPGTRLGWTTYWMTLSNVGQPVLNQFHVLRNRDTAEFDRVLQAYALDPANEADIDDAIHSWPAEAGTATVFIQPWADPAPTAQRRNRWDVFTTLLHEMMHKVAHPNFEATAQAVGGSAQKYLTEGFADLMRHDVLWDGPGQLRARLATPAMAPLRRRVEGGDFPYDAASVFYHGDYPEIAQAREIAQQVGMENCKAAFFLGRTDLLGIGAGTGATTPLAGIAEWSPSDSADAGIYVVQAGETLAQIAARTGVRESALRQENGQPLAAGAAPAAGTRLQAPGIRWVRSIQGDTLESLARQNGVLPSDVARANGMPPASPPSTAVPAGRRMLIPSHLVVR